MTSFKFDISTLPYPSLSRMHEPGQKPSRDRVLQTCLEISSNAASVVQSTLGAPGFGLLGIVTTAAEYTALTGAAFLRPGNPGAAPANCVRAWQEQWAQYHLMLQVETALRNQLLQAADDIYWRPLFQPVTGFGRRTALDFLTHIKAHYAAFDESVRANTLSTMNNGWSGEPFKIPIA